MVECCIEKEVSFLGSGVMFLFLIVWLTFAQSNSRPVIGEQSPAGTQGPPAGTLIVSNTPVIKGEEGYIVYFVIRSSGSRVDDMSLPGGSKAYVLFSLRAGKRYELLSYLRDCN